MTQFKTDVDALTAGMLLRTASSGVSRLADLLDEQVSELTSIAIALKRYQEFLVGELDTLNEQEEE